MVSTFDASVDGRPVWSVTSQRARSRGHGQGFREIQIQDLSVCDSLHRNNNKQKSVSAEENTDTKCISLHQPLVPRSPLQPARARQLQRAEILRDWIEKLPTEPKNCQPNPFFSPSEPTSYKTTKELNYRPYKYLSSPLPNFNLSPYSSDK